MQIDAVGVCADTQGFYSFSCENTQKSAFGVSGGSCQPKAVCSVVTALDRAIRQNDLREFASIMILVIFLRYLLGMLPGTRAAAKRTIGCREMVYPSLPTRSGFLMVAPHEWMSMDYVLTEGFPGYPFGGRGTFERANHPLRSVFRFARRLAWGPETYLVLAATVSVCNPRPHRT